MMIRVTSCFCIDEGNAAYERTIYLNKNLILSLEHSGRSDEIKTTITLQNSIIIYITESIDEILKMMEPST